MSLSAWSYLLFSTIRSQSAIRFDAFCLSAESLLSTLVCPHIRSARKNLLPHMDSSPIQSSPTILDPCYFADPTCEIRDTNELENEDAEHLPQIPMYKFWHPNLTIWLSSKFCLLDTSRPKSFTLCSSLHLATLQPSLFLQPTVPICPNEPSSSLQINIYISK